ncbi:unnamed protein product [Caenorhabditis sp. 36 PRJEB53466]|nr:unnamed protein product [Caenorhabditis sp. 36 PRJEB53466]
MQKKKNSKIVKRSDGNREAATSHPAFSTVTSVELSREHPERVGNMQALPKSERSQKLPVQPVKTCSVAARSLCTSEKLQHLHVCWRQWSEEVNQEREFQKRQGWIKMKASQRRGREDRQTGGRDFCVSERKMGSNSTEPSLYCTKMQSTRQKMKHRTSKIVERLLSMKMVVVISSADRNTMIIVERSTQKVMITHRFAEPVQAVRGSAKALAVCLPHSIFTYELPTMKTLQHIQDVSKNAFEVVDLTVRQTYAILSYPTTEDSGLLTLNNSTIVGQFLSHKLSVIVTYSVK